MKREMHDNIIQEKINSLQEIPVGVSFNPAKSWQQLEKQLQPKQKKYIVWLCAAVFTTAILISGLIYYTSNSSAPIKKEVFVKEPPLQSDKSTNIALQNEELKNQNKKTSVFVPQQKSNSINKSTVLENKINPDSIIKIEPILQNNSTAINQPLETKPFVETTVIKNAAKKSRFKIVHINELNTPQPQLITISKNASMEEIMYKSDISNLETKNNIKIFQIQRNQYNSPLYIIDNP